MGQIQETKKPKLEDIQKRVAEGMLMHSNPDRATMSSLIPKTLRAIPATLSPKRRRANLQRSTPEYVRHTSTLGPIRSALAKSIRSDPRPIAKLPTLRPKRTTP